MRYSDKLIKEHCYNLKTCGYTVFEDYLKDSSTCDFKTLLLKSIDEFDSDTFDSDRSTLDRYHIHDLITKDIMYGKLLEDVRLQQIIAPLLGDYWTMYAFTSSSAAPKSSNYGGRIHVDSPRWIQSYPTNIGAIWTLDDFTSKNGATWVLPASHHSEELPSEEYFENHAIQVECKKGSLIIFDARLVHRTGFNETDEWRHALTLNMCRSFMKQRMDWASFIPDKISNHLNSQARRIIGFDTRVPKNLEEFFVPEEARLYKANQG